jgi:hypothetical protein
VWPRVFVGAYGVAREKPPLRDSENLGGSRLTLEKDDVRALIAALRRYRFGTSATQGN